MSNAELTPGWAVVDNGKILVDTVSSTRRAAIVNYLVVYKGIRIFDSYSDAKIEELWAGNKVSAAVQEVKIAIDLP